MLPFTIPMRTRMMFHRQRPRTMKMAR
ncbi:hypothetical protein BN1708_019856 [Verticillium longisporum]|uniref:Uncharacterized protein n=1 Tax=Verticillium longisporum TaxID=100787 RepID=A0A0G4MNS2_VERLO|nr:hypothetical protein BN1708_019856 [Verticillium longisporum]